MSLQWKMSVIHSTEIFGLTLDFEWIADDALSVEDARKNGQEDTHMFGVIRYSEPDEEWIWCEVEGQNFDKYDDPKTPGEILKAINEHGPPCKSGEWCI